MHVEHHNVVFRFRGRRRGRNGLGLIVLETVAETFISQQPCEKIHVAGAVLSADRARCQALRDLEVEAQLHILRKRLS